MKFLNKLKEFFGVKLKEEIPVISPDPVVIDTHTVDLGLELKVPTSVKKSKSSPKKKTSNKNKTK